MQCGPVRHHVDPIRQAASRRFEHRVIVRPTAFCAARQARADARLEFREIHDELIADERRNELIFKDVIETVREGRSPVVLTERTEHVDRLAALLAPAVRHLVVLRGGAGRRELLAISSRLASIPIAEERVLLATGRYIGEGFDDARLDNVPASAVPGWPADVALPVDPRWKSDYAASVQRLVRDGIDAPLADLFVAAARAVVPGAEGADRARSATEAFLYRRLEMLPATAVCFRLNADLPIPFGGSGRMEVDLLCADARIAIELDGGQHLQSTEAYRRDRHEDALLQENGYFVLRFLAEDVGKRLDAVLDTIQRALVRRTAVQLKHLELPPRR